MVRHDVHEHAEPERSGGGGGGIQSLPTTAGRVDERMIDHVVAVVGALLRLEDGGEVEPVGPEIVNVARDTRRGV